MIAISLGWGVQSFTLAAMSALGALPQVDVAIHSDTAHEREATYAFAKQWTPWLEQHGIEVVTVSNKNVRGTQVVISDNETPIPAYTHAPGGRKKGGRLRRQCTYNWKISPLRAWVQEHREEKRVDLWMGISTDEWTRAKDADVKYIKHCFPLLDLNMSRSDCLEWLAAHDLPSPGKSSCVFCPFLKIGAWQEMKRAGGADWQHALEVDASIRNLRLPGELFVHPRRVPLDKAVVIPEDFGHTQLELLASDDEDAECDSGHCFL